MTITDYLINGLLVGLVVLQLRGRRVTMHSLLMPLAIVGVAAEEFLRSIPTAGNDLVLAVIGASAGLLLGTGAGLFTKVFRNAKGQLIAKATGSAALLWVLGVGSRIGFSFYAQHGGGAAIGRFSAAHDITTVQAWVACLILMSVAEVVSRTAVLALRARQAATAASAPAGSGAARLGAAA
ncbi:MAG TPA: hypothetical protein VMD59_20475 [Acidimicrobiales bacterium]|nr:hypothetical protein [Acidimicrobiales bacterium]